MKTIFLITFSILTFTTIPNAKSIIVHQTKNVNTLLRSFEENNTTTIHTYGFTSKMESQNKFPLEQIQIIPYYIIYFNLTSPNYFIEGCTYWLTATVAYQFNNNNELIGIQISYPSLNWSCPETGIMYVRPVSINVEVNNQRAGTILFILTGDAKIDHVLTDAGFLNSIKSSINDNIPTR